MGARNAFIIILSLLMASGIFMENKQPPTADKTETNPLQLPKPTLRGVLSVEETLHDRRSVRDYSLEPLSREEAGQLLWAAQGVTDNRGYRTAPSAGALYPLEVYLVAGEVTGLEAGVYRYVPTAHALSQTLSGDRRAELARAALDQQWVREGKAVIVITAVIERTARKYGGRATRYVHMESGAAAQNVYLQAVSLKLGTVIVGAFDDNAVNRVLNLPANEQPLVIMPVGKLK